MRISDRLPFIGLLCLGAVLVTALPGVSLGQQPLAYWTFEDSLGVADSSASGAFPLNFQTQDMILGSDAPQVGQYFRYIDTLLIPGQDSLEEAMLTNREAVSLECWIRPSKDFTFGELFAWEKLNIRLEENAYKVRVLDERGFTGRRDTLIRLNGIGRRDPNYLRDGNWHHLAVTFNTKSGIVKLYVDGISPNGFKANLGNGMRIYNGFPTVFLLTPANRAYEGDLDEIAVYDVEISAELVWQHYQNGRNNQHYDFALQPGQTVQMEPVVEGAFNPLEFPPGYPLSTGNSLEMLRHFPSARYRPQDTILPRNLPWINDLTDVANSINQPKLNPFATQNALEATEIAKFLAEEYNYYLYLGNSKSAYGTSYWSATSQFGFHLGPMADSLPNLPRFVITNWNQLDSRALYPGSAPGPYMKDVTLADTFYVRNAAGAVINPNAYWSWAAHNGLRRDTLARDGEVQGRAYLGSLLSQLSIDRIDMIGENGEVLVRRDTNTLTQDPRIAIIDRMGIPWREYQSRSARRFREIYSGEFMNYLDTALTGNPNSPLLYWYNIGGNEGVSHFTYDSARTVNSVAGGYRRASPYYYPQSPARWRFNGNNILPEFQHVIVGRLEEMAQGDSLYLPGVSPGLNDGPYVAADEARIRPGQFLGTLKSHAMLGADAFNLFMFHSSTNHRYQGNWLIWETVMPPLAQAITGRANEFWYNGRLMPGNPNIGLSGTYSNNDFIYATGNMNSFVLARRAYGSDRLLIMGTHQRTSNMQSSGWKSADVCIDLLPELQFNTRLQGSTYILDTSASPPVFYQLDSWHEWKDPSQWCPHFAFEAEVFDNVPDSVEIRTDRPSGVGTWDFRVFTSYIAFQDTSGGNLVPAYGFCPRDQVDSLRIWVRARNYGTQASDIEFDLDGGAAVRSVSVAADTTWQWYHFNGGSPQVFLNVSPDQHTLTLNPTDTDVQIDKFILLTRPGTMGDTLQLAISGDTVCIGDTVWFSPAGSIPGGCMDYAWDFGDGTTASDTTAWKVYPYAGTYEVTLLARENCSGTSDTSLATVWVVAPEVDAGPDTLVCLGDTLDLQGTATWPYKWRPDPNLDAIVVLDPTVTPPVSQYFYLEAYDPTSGCSAYDSVFVTMLEQRLSYEDTFYICDSASVQLEVLGAYNIVWTPSGSLDDPNAIDPVATPDSTTTYVFQAWDACGCDTITNSVTVFVVDTPQVVAMADTTICDGNAFALTATGLSMYTWNGPAFNAVTSTGLVEVPRFDITQTSQTRNYFVGGTMCGVSVLDTVVVTVLNSPALDTARVIPGQRYQEPGAAVSFDIAPTGLPLFSWTPAAYLNNAGLAEPTVTSEVDTTFTLTLTGGNGCVTDYNFDIEWARIQGADTVEFCPGGPVDLQVTPVLFREWFPTAMFPSPYNHTVRIYPDSSGWVFNAYRDLGWPSTLRDSVYLLEIDPPQILTADTTLCYGDTLTLQAIGADEFLWFPTIGLSDSLVSNPLLTATQSEIYRVMNCEVPYCFAHDSVEIRVDSVPLSATLLTGNQSLCPGDSVQLFATGANQYTWTPGASLDSASISAPTAGPALTTTYTVAMSNSGFCFVEDSLIVAVDTAAPNGTLVVSDSVICPGDTVTLTASGGTFYTWTSSVGGNVINGSNGAVQTAAPANDATYYVSVSNGGACPWQDSLVVVDTNCCDVPGTTLRFSPRASSWTGPTSGGNYHIVDTFRVDTNIFFFNTTFSMDSAAVIYVEVGDTLDTQGCHFIAACNGMWEGIVLESAGARLIGKTDTLAQAVRAVAAHGGASFLITNSIFEANYIGVAVDSSPTLPSYPGSILSCTFEGGALLPPMDTAFASYAGIKVEHVRGLTIGTSGFAGVAPNKFAELEYGVHVLHSDVRLYHNAFGNLQRRSTIGPVGGIAGSGTAIYSNAAGAASFAERLVVGLESGYSGQDLLHHANTFDSCHYGVHARGSQDVFIRGNEMDSLYGYGIFVTRLDGDSLFIERNTIEQSPLGVFAGRIRETEAKIYENTIFGDRLNARHGMRFDYVFYPSLNQVDSTYKFNVTHNDIRVQGNAIWMVNVDHLNVQENYVGVKLPSAGTPVGTLNGVYLAAASGPNRIMSNDIQSEASTWEVDSLVQVRGVYVEGSPETVVNCNDVRDIGRCIEWRNSCNPSDMHKNLMINAVDGLSLRDFGEIGPQGDTLRPSDNRWQGSNFTNSQTQSEGSIGEDSKFFVRWSPTYYPGTNTGVGSPNIPVAFDSIASTSFETLKCSERGTGIQVLNSMMNIIQNRYSEGSYVDVTQFNADHWVIRAIVRDSAYLEEDSLIQDFWDTYEDSAITSVVRISEAIAELNASQASDLLGSYTPDCVIEENLEDVFDIELDLLDSDLGLDNTESETLENLAELCPLVGGIAVHRARSLLSMAEDLSWDYDDCSSDSKARLSNSPEPESVRGILEVWPNPANEDLNIRFKGQLESGSKVQVIDGHGRILMQEAMPSHSEILRFATRGWSDGLYSVRLLTPTGRSFMGKVVIFHR